jgi:hypothetical protein
VPGRIIVDWVEGELKKEQASAPPGTEPSVRSALSPWYESFSAHLREDVDEFNRDRGGAAEIEQSGNDVVVLNNTAGVKGTFTTDLGLQQVRSEYTPVRELVAVPEGEIFTLRLEHGRLAIFSADQEIREEDLRKMLLKPVLFPEDAS